MTWEMTWTYEGQYRKTFDSIEQIVGFFSLNDHEDAPVDGVWTEEQAIATAHDIMENDSLFPDILEDLSDNNHWIAGELDMADASVTRRSS